MQKGRKPFFVVIDQYLVKHLNLFRYIVKCNYIESEKIFMEQDKARLKDQELIRKLKNQYNLSDDAQVLRLYQEIESGNIQFYSQMGRDFDDQIFERVSMLKQVKRIRDVSQEMSNPNVEKSKEIREIKDINGSKDISESKDTHKNIEIPAKKRLLHRLVKAIVLIGAIVCLVYFGAYAYEAYQSDIRAKKMANIKDNETLNNMYSDQVIESIDEKTGEKKYYKILDSYKSLYNQNKNLIGWLKIDDTIIDYPIMQTQNEDYYLSHNVNQEEDKNGALFMDSECDVKKPSTNFIIYGHNMKSGKMFGSLTKYKDRDYYLKHKEIQFDTIYETGSYEVMYVFQSKVFRKDEIVFKYYEFIEAYNEKEFNAYMKEMELISVYNTGVKANYGDQLLTLSTCDYEDENGRFVVVAKKMK